MGAFAGAHMGKPFIEGIPMSGASLVGFGLVSRWKLQKAGLPLGLANLAMAAGATLIYLGGQLILKREGILKEMLPGLTAGQLAQLASCFFGVANYAKFIAMVQADAKWDGVRTGQLFKITASSFLATGNALGLGWQDVNVPVETAWDC